MIFSKIKLTFYRILLQKKWKVSQDKRFKFFSPKVCFGDFCPKMAHFLTHYL